MSGQFFWMVAEGVNYTADISIYENINHLVRSSSDILQNYYQ